MDQGRRRRRDRKLPLELGLPGLEKPQLLLQRLDRGVIIGDELDQLAGPALDAGQVRFLTVEGRILFAAQPVHLAVELLAELLEQVGGHQPDLRPARTASSRTWIRMFRRLLQVPLLRAAAQPKRFWLILT